MSDLSVMSLSALKQEMSSPPILDGNKAQATDAQDQQDAQKQSVMSSMYGWLQILVDWLRGVFAWADQSNPQKQKRYRQALRRRRIRTICLKLFFNMLFLFSWSFLALNPKTYKWLTLLGGNFWIDFGVYAGISAGFPLFLFIGLLRKGILVSQVWFEAVWLLGVSGFDIFLICRLGKHPPPSRDWTSSVYGDPYQTVSVVLYGFTVTSLAFDLLFSLLWSGYVSILAWRNPTRYPTIWLAHAADFPWASPSPSPNPSRSSLELLIGIPQEPPARRSIPTGVKNWILGSTMFRRFASFEPFAHCVTRGCVALIFWIILIVYAILNCAINPISQFTSSKGLPTRSLTQDSRPTGTFGHISGFIALDVVPYSQYETKNGSWEFPEGVCDGIFGGTDAFFTNPFTGQDVTCNVQCGGLKYLSQGDMFLQVEARWDCGPIWDHLAFQTSVTASNKRPSVTVTWNSAFYQDKPLRSAGLLSVPATPNAANYSSVVSWGNGSPREWKHGVTFNLTAGQIFGVDVGRRRIYGNRATFLDLIGVSQRPDVFATYPILSINSTESSTPTRTAINFYPAFGAWDDEIVEEYLEFSVLSGLSTTGGLYSSFEVIFILIFGRTLLAALFGGKHVTPFGAIASMLRRDSFRDGLLDNYPGIEGKDRAERAHATCDFLHDFVLDLKPLEVPDCSTVSESGKVSSQTKPAVDGNDGKEVVTPPAQDLPYQNGNFVGGFPFNQMPAGDQKG